MVPDEDFTYPLVNSHITMENHHFQWVNPNKSPSSRPQESSHRLPPSALVGPVGALAMEPGFDIPWSNRKIFLGNPIGKF